MLPKRLIFVALALTILVACAGMMPETPQDKSDFAMSYWLAQKQDYKVRYALATTKNDNGETVWKDSATQLEKDIIRAKYQFIKNAEEPIAIYDSYVQNGQVPPAALEQTVNTLINGLKQYLIEHQGG